MTERGDNAGQDTQHSDLVGVSPAVWKLVKLFVSIWVVVVLVNLIAGAVLVGIQIRAGNSTMVRDDSRRLLSRSWPASPPLSAQWPDPKHVAKFHSSTPFVYGVYAISWDSDGRRYTMDVLGAELTISGFAIRKTRVFSVDDDGEMVEIQRDNRIMMPDLIGLLINPLILTLGIWVLIGLIPLWDRVSRLRAAERERVQNLNCLRCGYDIQDLPICPECGTPSHRVESDPARTQPGDGSCR